MSNPLSRAANPQQSARPRLSPTNLPRRSEFLYTPAENVEPDVERLRIELFTEAGNRLFLFDNMLVQQVSDLDVEKLQFDISAHGLTKGIFFDRNVKALSVSAIIYDLEQGDDSRVIQNQLALFEYLYTRYLRAPQAVKHRYEVRLTVQQHQYTGVMTNVIIALASDDDNVGAVSFTFMVIDEDVDLDVLPTVATSDGTRLGPATFSVDTYNDMVARGDVGEESVEANAVPDTSSRALGRFPQSFRE